MTIISTVAAAQEKYLFAGTYTSGESKGIYVYRFNTGTGDFTPVSTVATENPSYLTVSSDARFLYAANENGGKKPGEVSAFSFDAATGTLKFINKQESGGDHPCYIAIDGSNQWVAVGNYSGGNLSIYRVQQDGSLGKAVQTIQHKGHSVNSDRQAAPYVHAVVFTPDQRKLVVSDLGLDQLLVYDFDAKKDKPLNEKPVTVATAPGSGPRHIIFHQSLPYAYTIEELSGKVSAYQYKDGSLTSLQTLSSHPAGYKGEIGSAAIRISPDGKFVYASNRGESNTIAIYAVDQANGKLTSKAFPSTGGKNPRDFEIDPTGNFLLAANGSTNDIVIFSRDKNTGLIKPTGKKITIPSPVFLKIIN